MTYTSSFSSSYSKADVKNVMRKIYEDFHNIKYRGFFNISNSYLANLKEDLIFVLDQKALIKFQFQFFIGEKSWALEYEVLKDGTFWADNESGGTNFYSVPPNATIKVVMQRDQSNGKVSEYLKKRGWGNQGQMLAGPSQDISIYSKNRLGIQKREIGSWKS